MLGLKVLMQRVAQQCCHCCQRHQPLLNPVSWVPATVKTFDKEYVTVLHTGKPKPPTPALEERSVNGDVTCQGALSWNSCFSSKQMCSSFVSLAAAGL
jgi:hypothetical protein|mmetsp:Transcript_8199/g.15860  ORF Transcript_8199/g.15860 Transcript_8199/m.15860 type:complete len:98 (-) Transcript_8199:176-469(-)